MTEPKLFDARRGLSPEALDCLRGAHSVSMAVKNTNTAAFGIWVGDELSVVLIEGRPSFLMQVRRVPLMTNAGAISTLSSRHMPQGHKGVVCDLLSTGSESFWSRFLGLVRVGDVLRVEPDRDKPGMFVLQVYADRSVVASLRLPKTSEHQRGQSVA